MNDDTGDGAFARQLRAALDARRDQGLLRTRRIVAAHSGMLVEVGGRTCVNFSSNDYLGLRNHPAIVAAASEATLSHGTGSGASALVTGYTAAHASAERALAAWKGTDAAVLLPSGYQANHAAVQTIARTAEATDRHARFLLDKLVHASLIDAVRGTGMPMRVFPHNGVDKLARLLDEADAGELQVVVTESIFSMDGDAADLRAIVNLKRRRPFVLVVDEAHGSGVYGDDGAGYAVECGVARDVDVFVVTLSKALGSIGGAVCASSDFCEAIVNFGRAYVYSTSVPPAVAAAAEAAVGVLRAEPQRRRRVRSLASRVREHLRAAGRELPPGDSPIVPIILGTEDAAVGEAARLLELGMLAAPIRPPTVPRGSSRLRITLSSEHTDDQVDALLAALTSKEKSP